MLAKYDRVELKFKKEGGMIYIIPHTYLRIAGKVYEGIYCHGCLGEHAGDGQQVEGPGGVGDKPCSLC